MRHTDEAGENAVRLLHVRCELILKVGKQALDVEQQRLLVRHQRLVVVR